MKYLFLSALFLSLICNADCDEIYFKVGAGYKFDEPGHAFTTEGQKVTFAEFDPISARIESGVNCGPISFGISHHSQWGTGFPINQTGEPYKTEFFIDYKISWGI